MALSIVHNKVATLPDEAGAEVNAPEWNAAHDVAGTVDVADISGLGSLATQNGTFSGTSSGTNTGDQTNISGNAGTVTTNANLTGPVTSVGNVTTLAVVTAAASGFAPTVSASVNTTGTPTMSTVKHLRVGDTVTMSGQFTVAPTLTATITSFEFTLPVASNIGAVSDISGVAFCGAIAGMGAEVIGVVANDTAKVKWVSTDITAQTWSWSAQYTVI